jgi:integrase
MVAQMVDAYLSSPEFTLLAEKTQEDYTRYLLEFRRILGTAGPDEIRPSNLVKLRDLYASTPSTANHLLSVIQTLYTWAIPRDYAMKNPAVDTPRLKHKVEGHKPWPDWAFKIAQDHMRYDLFVAVQLGRYTGQRLTDVLAMTLHKIDWSGEWPVIELVQHKTGKSLWVPAHPELAPLLRELKTRGWIYLAAKVKPATEPYTAEQFQAAWGREMKKDSVKVIRDADLSFHGLRKSACVALAECGCTDEEIMAVTGLSRAMISTYTAGVNRRKMAHRAMAKWRGEG